MTPQRILSYTLTAIIAGFAGYMVRPNSAPVDCNNVVMNYSNTPANDTIDGYALLEMTQKYKDALVVNNAGKITNAFTKNPSNNIDSLPDATSVWFGLEDLKRFIWEIESKVCTWRASCPQTPPLDLGIRIYYARYPDATYTNSNGQKYFNDLPAEYENRHTVFMVPTFDPVNSGKSGRRRHIDFNLNAGPNNGYCQRDAMSKDAPSFRAITVLFPNGKNHGDLCPPVCSGRDAAFGQ